jgi:hypothetical protein
VGIIISILVFGSKYLALRILGVDPAGGPAIPVFLLQYACYLPGLVMFSFLFASPSIVVVEKTGVMASLRRSIRLSRGAWLRVLFIIWIIDLIQIVFRWFVIMIFDLLTFEGPASNQSADSIEEVVRLIHYAFIHLGLSLAVTILFCIWAAIASALVYFNLRTLLERAEEELAAVFE